MKALGILGKTPGKCIWMIKKSVSLYHLVANPSPLHRLTSCEWISWTPHMSEKKGTITAPCMGEIGNNGATSMRETWCGAARFLMTDCFIFGCLLPPSCGSFQERWISGELRWCWKKTIQDDRGHRCRARWALTSDQLRTISDISGVVFIVSFKGACLCESHRLRRRCCLLVCPSPHNTQKHALPPYLHECSLVHRETGWWCHSCVNIAMATPLFPLPTTRHSHLHRTL